MSATPHIDLVITDRSGAGRILCSPERCAQLGAVISIGDVAGRLPAGWRNARRKLRLLFEDVLLEEQGGPVLEDVARLVRFAREIDPTRGTLLVHCQAGISRSTAAAAIALAVLWGPGYEEAALREVYRVQPEARPNRRMLELADTVLGNGSALLAAAEAAAEAAADQRPGPRRRGVTRPAG